MHVQLLPSLPVSTVECEKIFFNKPTLVKHDKEHSSSENRYYVFGRTNLGRLLLAVFTVRGEKIVPVHRIEMPRNSKPTHSKCLQGAVDARRRACKRSLSYFKGSGTK
ncbi:BrnT family toxin [Desulfosarcina widdelii]|uniref:BrnT family toxin n=1 Tax=Desulfosarcina widdelii TaxID=947919 RepID=UPI0014782E5B